MSLEATSAPGARNPLAHVADLVARNHSSRFIWSHRLLLTRVTRGELKARYAGSMLGVAWAAIAPALILAVYAAVYLLVLRIRVPALDSTGYVLYIFAGLVPYLATAEAVSTGVSSVIANKSVLNNTVFPIDLAPVKAVLLAQTTMGVGLTITIAGVALSGHAHWTILLVPAIWALLIVSLIGINWIISLLNVLFRDLQNLVGALLMVMLIASPIAYTPSMVPDSLRQFILINPFASFVIAFQEVLVVGSAPSLKQWIALAAISFGLFAVGGWFFSRTRPVLIDYV